jgi:hypothetical protein
MTFESMNLRLPTLAIASKAQNSQAQAAIHAARSKFPCDAVGWKAWSVVMLGGMVIALPRMAS